MSNKEQTNGNRYNPHPMLGKGFEITIGIHYIHKCFSVPKSRCEYRSADPVAIISTVVASFFVYVVRYDRS
ncbi:hypothetical protein CC78DRAFT_263575 [Lojkania enalia]|uniref:Uncharacterized protein n=1 Tax=Lojkania enalia TaxID=147567 RepID=A0A9P4K7B8_9PLEO|nr:hypothetical protein CC78DRAFT_263575 [Didymosphaeria enalia]